LVAGVISTKVSGAVVVGLSYKVGCRRARARFAEGERIVDQSCRFHHDRLRELTPSSDANAQAVSPLLFHYATRAAHSLSCRPFDPGLRVNNCTNDPPTSGTRFVERIRTVTFVRSRHGSEASAGRRRRRGDAPARQSNSVTGALRSQFCGSWRWRDACTYEAPVRSSRHEHEAPQQERLHAPAKSARRRRT
jgi:hypothetical protein